MRIATLSWGALICSVIATGVVAEDCIDRFKGSNLAWVCERVLSVAKIDACDVAADCSQNFVASRSGSGFVVALDGGRKVLVTALHVVAGAEAVRYKLTQRIVHRTTVVEVAAENDVALLEIDQADENVPGLPVLKALLGPGAKVVPISYTSGAPEPASGTGTTLLLSGGTLEGVLATGQAQAVVDNGFPSLSMPIVGLQDALAAGDSGGPVFNEAGEVVGIGEGGQPSSSGKLTWMVPVAAALDASSFIAATASPFVLPSTRTALTMQFSYFEESTPVSVLGDEPELFFALQIPGDWPPFAAYGKRVDGAPDRMRLFDDSGRLHISPIGTDDVLFPGNAADKSEDEVLATLDSLKLTINCFSRSDFQQILDAKAVPLRWELSVAIGPIRDRVEAGTLRLGYTVADFVPSVTMYSNPIWTIKRFADGSSLDVDGSLTVRDMIGGACRLEVNSIPPSTTAPSLMSALARGSACIFIDFGAGLSTQLWFLGAAPLFGDIDRPEQWGLISLKWREKSGDAFCGRPPL